MTDDEKTMAELEAEQEAITNLAVVERIKHAGLNGVQPKNPLRPLPPGAEREHRVTSSYDLSTESGRHNACRAGIFQEFKAREIIDKPLEVVDWVTFDAEATDKQTGEEHAFIKTVLVLEDGRRVSLGSDWVVVSLIQLSLMKGPAPWNPPLSVCVRVGKSGSGRSFYALDLL